MEILGEGNEMTLNDLIYDAHPEWLEGQNQWLCHIHNAQTKGTPDKSMVKGILTIIIFLMRCVNI